LQKTFNEIFSENISAGKKQTIPVTTGSTGTGIHFIRNLLAMIIKPFQGENETRKKRYTVGAETVKKCTGTNTLVED
jgi:hypothetical protein